MQIGLTKNFISKPPRLNAAVRKGLANLTTAYCKSFSGLNAAFAGLNAATCRKFFADFGSNQKLHNESLQKILRVNCLADRGIVGNCALARDEKFFNRAVRADKRVPTFDNVDRAIFKLDGVRLDVFYANISITN